MDTTMCRFCQIERGVITEPYNRPINENEKFFSLASIGAFIPGWSLIVPKEHVYSMRKVYSDPSFLDFANSWIKHVQNIFEKNVIAFEHGANHCGSQTSCGTNHGHLHVVPFDKSLVRKMQADREWVSVSFEQISKIVGGDEYLLYTDIAGRLEDSKFYLHILHKEESQYFRRLLANEVGVKDYSYKTSPYYDYTVRSYQKLVGVAE